MTISQKFLLSFIFIATILLGCGNEKRLNEEVNSEFGKILNDPLSLQLKNVKYFGDDTVCGEFNAKNDKGGYVGFQPFIYQKNGVLGGREYEYALGREVNPTYTELLRNADRISAAEKSLSGFSTSPFVVGAGSKSPTTAMWREAAETWCSNSNQNEKLKNGKIAFIKLLIESFNDKYISSLENDCKNNTKQYQLYMDAANLGRGFSVTASSSLSVNAELACDFVKRAKDIRKAAADNLTQINNSSSK